MNPFKVACDPATQADYQNNLRRKQVIAEFDMDTWQVRAHSFLITAEERFRRIYLESNRGVPHHGIHYPHATIRSPRGEVPKVQRECQTTARRRGGSAAAFTGRRRQRRRRRLTLPSLCCMFMCNCKFSLSPRRAQVLSKFRNRCRFFCTLKIGVDPC